MAYNGSVYGAWPVLKPELRLNCNFICKLYFGLPRLRPCTIHIVVGWRPLHVFKALSFVLHAFIHARRLSRPILRNQPGLFSTPGVRLAMSARRTSRLERSAKFPALAHNVYI